MRGLDPRILFGGHEKDGRDKPGHDERESARNGYRTIRAQ
jgi:hypothetical protein